MCKAGQIWISKTGIKVAVVFENNGKSDIMFNNKSQFRDLPNEVLKRDYTLLKDLGSTSKAIDFILGDNDG